MRGSVLPVFRSSLILFGERGLPEALERAADQIRFASPTQKMDDGLFHGL
jgi:hypothetical protein